MSRGRRRKRKRDVSGGGNALPGQGSARGGTGHIRSTEQVMRHERRPVDPAKERAKKTSLQRMFPSRSEARVGQFCEKLNALKGKTFRYVDGVTQEARILDWRVGKDKVVLKCQHSGGELFSVDVSVQTAMGSMPLKPGIESTELIAKFGKF